MLCAGADDDFPLLTFFCKEKKKPTNHEELLLAESQGLGGQTVASFWPGEDVVLLP